jgi:hypothetical protein
MIKISIREQQHASENNRPKLFLIDKKKEPQFLTQAHKKNYEKAMESRTLLDPSKIDWNEEVERQKRNARND